MEKGYERDAGVSEHHIGISKFQFESLFLVKSYGIVILRIVEWSPEEFQ